MSWMKRGQASAGPGTQPYAAAPQAQPFGNQQNMYPNYEGSTGGAPTQPQQTQQQFWQLPPQQPPQPAPQQQFNHAQHYGQSYPQDYPPNANQYQQPNQTQYNQNYANQYASSQQIYQQSYYQNQPAQPNLQQSYNQNAAVTGTGNADGWEDNWDWGWEENAKKAQSLQNTSQQAPVQQQVFNNANVIEESFATTDSWNWAMDENKEKKAPTALPPPRQENNEPATLTTLPVQNNVIPEPAQNNIRNQQAVEVKTLSDREVIKERLPNLALGKRFHIENLTPQWSIESQMSQESSDGPQTQSEGTYRSENQSRNSGESPGPNMDSSNFNYTQPGFDETYTQNSEWSKNSEEPTMADGAGLSGRESREELSNSLQEMSIDSNHHFPNATPTHAAVESSAYVQENVNMPPSSCSPAHLDHLVPAVTGSASAPAMSMPPPPGAAAVPSQLPPQAPLPRPPSSQGTAAPPPMQVAPPQLSPTPSPPAPPNSQNPFQRAGPFSHKSTTKPVPAPAAFQPQLSGSNLTSPAVVSKVSQGRAPVGFEANLESAPDNSERPDQPQVPFRAIPMSQPIPDNMEVAPQNDRNEYLQTAHLSSGDYGENTDFTRNLPPPGLRRMVVGQQESEYQSVNISGDEPPPGLSRMVPGQQTEADNAYNQPSDNYMDRHIDGQPMDSAGSTRPFRQADGQQNPDNYSQPITTRANDRRPIGLDRMVPGEPSNDQYSQYQASNYASNEHRVVTGVDRDFPSHIDASPSDVREQNMDGSDYTEPAPRNVIGAREAANDIMVQDFAAPEETQREVTMEGENLQDLSTVSSADLNYSREHLHGADPNVTDGGTDRNDASDSLDRPATTSRKQSLNRVHSSGDESERDRAFKSSPRRDRHKTSRDRDRGDRNRERDKEVRYSRGDRSDRKYDRDERRRDDKRTDKDRRDRDRGRTGHASPDTRKQRRSTRSRNCDDDTDYYSDRERDRRRYREGSYTSKPPRPEGDRRYEERRYATAERERRDRPRDPAPRDRDRDRDRYDRHYADYRDIDPSRKYGNLHREREEDRRRVTFSTDAKSNDSKSEGDTFSSASRPDSREAGATDEDAPDARRSQARTRRARHHRPDPYYDGYGGVYQDPYLVQRQQYEYYEQLRVTDPAAYMVVYKQLMAGHAPRDIQRHAAYVAGEGYPGLGYEGQERASVHSGRSSTTGHKGNDTFYVYRHDAASLRDAPSLRTDISDRDLNTEASLGLQLDASTVRSDRMTPFRYSTAHAKGSISSRDIVLVPPSYPVDGKPATVQVLSLAAARASDPAAAELVHSPSPLIKGVTHKKSVIDYCMVRVRNASREGASDVIGYLLLWELLALMLRQNGVVVGTDIAELLVKNAKEYEHKSTNKPTRNDSRGGSSLSGSLQEDTHNSTSPPLSGAQHHDYSLSETMGAESLGSPCVDEKAALDKFREYLLYGNRQEALEWAMSNNLWGHALQLAGSGERRVRAAVSARFLSAIPRTDPLHTLYATRNNAQPHANTCACGERGEWRTHAAMLLANTSARPDYDARTLTSFGDSLASRGLIYSAQFCYVSAGVPFSQHPLAPLSPPLEGSTAPRLSLLLGEQRAETLAQLASTRAILATEIYEYARSLNADYVITHLQVYKLIAACRLVDAGQYERALGYVETAARAVTRDPRLYSMHLVRALAALADRLKYHDPAVGGEGGGVVGVAGAEEEGESGEGSPRQQWLDDVNALAHNLQVESASQQVTPQHQYSEQNQHAWGNQAQQYPETLNNTSVKPEETPDYTQYYQPLPMPVPPTDVPTDQPDQYTQPDQPSPYTGQADQPGPYPSQQNEQYTIQPPQDETQYHYEDWSRTEETHSQSYGDPYWQTDNYGYGESTAEGEGSPRPAITMPGSAPANQTNYSYDDDRPPTTEQADREDAPKSSKDKSKEVKTDSKGRSWIGGILTKLSLRPPNQMILPDDKNPTIVWDAERKRWRNTDGTEDEVERPPPPPPTGRPPPSGPTAPPTGRPPGSAPTAPPAQRQGNASPPLQGAASGGPLPVMPVSNIFKMQKGRHIKKSYVDVFNPRGAASGPPPPAAPPAPPAPDPLHNNINYFVPTNTSTSLYVSIPLPSNGSPRTSPPLPTTHEGPYEADDDQYPRSGI